MPLPIVWQIIMVEVLINQLGFKKNGTHLVMLKDIKDILKTQQRVLQKSNVFMDNLCIIYFYWLDPLAKRSMQIVLKLILGSFSVRTATEHEIS